MFTIKLYTCQGRQMITEADSFTILRGDMDKCFEVTCHLRTDESTRFDVGPTGLQPSGGNWDYAFIVNSSGKTVEHLTPRTPPDGLPAGG